MSSSDRPGLLARLGIIFVELGINVQRKNHDARRRVNLFYISDGDGLPIEATRAPQASHKPSASDSIRSSTKKRQCSSR